MKIITKLTKGDHIIIIITIATIIITITLVFILAISEKRNTLLSSCWLM